MLQGQGETPAIISARYTVYHSYGFQYVHIPHGAIADGIVDRVRMFLKIAADGTCQIPFLKPSDGHGCDLLNGIILFFSHRRIAVVSAQQERKPSREN